MDVGIIAAIAMLVLWAVGTLLEAPGWIHLLLTLGMFLLMYRIVVRGTPGSDRGKRPRG
ncbi:MAG: hypothetical protein ACRENI_01515 [Gemmatimonadaceae bacterium]